MSVTCMICQDSITITPNTMKTLKTYPGCRRPDCKPTGWHICMKEDEPGNCQERFLDSLEEPNAKCPQCSIKLRVTRNWNRDAILVPYDTKRKAEEEEDSGAELRAREASMAKAGEVASEWRTEAERQEAEQREYREQKARENQEQTLDLLSGEGNADNEELLKQQREALEKIEMEKEMERKSREMAKKMEEGLDAETQRAIAEAQGEGGGPAPREGSEEDMATQRLIEQMQKEEEEILKREKEDAELAKKLEEEDKEEEKEDERRSQRRTARELNRLQSSSSSSAAASAQRRASRSSSSHQDPNPTPA